MPSPVIIIGSGLAGLTLAKEFRKLKPEAPLTLITEEAGHFYSKPMLSTALNQGKAPEQLIMTQANALQSQLDATFYTQASVESIDAENKSLVVRTKEGLKTLSYDSLVLAVGAKPKPFALLESFKENYRINHLSQYADFIQAIKNKKRLTIIGSGLVGCEFAHDLSHHNYEISLVTPDPHPLYGLIPALPGQYLQEALIQKGIDWHGNTTLCEAKEQGNEIVLNLSNDKTLRSEAILCAIGLLPHIALAKAANLEVNKGIVVSQYLRTSNPHIYALGDCAEIVGICRQFVAPILHCARALARTLSGEETAAIIPPTPVVLKVNAYPLIVFPPSPNIAGKWEIEDNDGNVKGSFFDENGILQGYVLTGKATEERQLMLKRMTEQQV